MEKGLDELSVRALDAEGGDFSTNEFGPRFPGLSGLCLLGLFVCF